MSEVTLTRKPRTVERRVQHLFVQYRSVQMDHEGNDVEVLLTAHRGEVATFTLPEAARLDALGALAPEGHTVEMIREDIERGYEAYVGQRRAITDDWSVF